MKSPIVSVIVPAYNVESYILKCIESILSSTLRDIEVIVIDDCSTDNTLKILRSIKDSRLKIITLPTRSGVSAARNTGIDLAMGKYISFIDGDDWISPIMFESLVNKAEITDADLAFCGLYRVYSDKTIKMCDISEDLVFIGKTRIDQYIHMFLIKDKREYEPYFSPIGATLGSVYKADIILKNNIRFIEGMQYKEDVIFNLYVAQQSNSIIRLHDSLYYYNKCNQGSLTTSEFKKGMSERIEKDIQERGAFLHKYRQEDEVFKAGYFQWAFRNFYAAFVPACVTDSSYAKCNSFYHSEIFKEAIQNIRPNELKPKERILFFLLKLHGLPLYYSGVKAYMEAAERYLTDLNAGTAW